MCLFGVSAQMCLFGVLRHLDSPGLVCPAAVEDLSSSVAATYVGKVSVAQHTASRVYLSDGPQFFWNVDTCAR